ncbi:hypothetical protein BH23ACT12_BH23ACT12_12440 [soil metagenome]
MSSGALPAGRTHLLSTSGMQSTAAQSETREIIVATETGLLHSLRKNNPQKQFIAANEDAVCKYMKMITPANLLSGLENLQFEVTVPRDIADKARLALERMISL